MKYLATFEGQAFEIEIRNEGEVIVNGKRALFDFQTIRDEPVYSLLLDGKSYEALVHSSENGLEVLLRGLLYQVYIEDERQRKLRESSEDSALPDGEYRMKAPMPGLVIAVPVDVGEQVEKGQNLVILESMKMQNELKAPRGGVVNRILIERGDNVEQNQILLVLT
jgi:biotin carboxyl carrier protein